MTKDLEVIKAFHIPIDDEEIINLQKTHSYIADKLILDAVNGVNVVARDFHNINKSRQSFTNRVWDGFTGSTRKRQDLINENVIEGITACTSWLRDHDKHISRIDTRIYNIASELDRTQDEILKFYGQHKVLSVNVGELKEVFFEFRQSSTQRFNLIEEKIKDIDLRDNAYNQIAREIAKLNANRYAHLNSGLRVYTVLDNLKSGDVGLYYHNIKAEREKKEIKEFVQDSISRSLNNMNDTLVDYQQIINDTNQLTQVEKDAISLISTEHYNSMLIEGESPEVADLISIVSSYSKIDASQEILTQSNIRNFITYDDFIETSTNEHFLA